MFLDAKGKPCPQPVVLALKALPGLSGGEALTVAVDNEAAVQNLTRMGGEKGCAVQTETLPAGGWAVTLTPGAAPAQPASGAPFACDVPAAPAAGSRTVVAIGTDAMGRGSEELGHILLKGFLYALAQLETPPQTLLFFNGGARLTVEGSASLADIRDMESRGAEVLTCGTCLDYYGIKDKLAVGQVTNMYSITEKLTGAAHLVQL